MNRIKRLPIDPRHPRMRSVELINARGEVLVVGRSVGANGTDGTYAEAATAARVTQASLQGYSDLLKAVFQS